MIMSVVYMTAVYLTAVYLTAVFDAAVHLTAVYPTAEYLTMVCCTAWAVPGFSIGEGRVLTRHGMLSKMWPFLL